jgi:hypothetical protein
VLSKSAALIGLARLEPSALKDADYDAAVSLARAPVVELLPWADGHLAHWLATAVAEAAAAQGKLPVLWRLIDARAGALPGPADLALLLAKRVLRPHAGPRLRSAEELGESERGLLSELCSRQLVNGGIETLAGRAGLFDRAAAIARLLGLPDYGPFGPLDVEVEEEPLWRIFNDHLNDRLSFDELASAVDTACDGVDLLDLLYDAATGYPIDLQWPISSNAESPVRAALAADLIARLLARRSAPETWAAELRSPRGGPPIGKFNTSGHRIRQWTEALLLALARSPKTSEIESDPALKEHFLTAADTSSKRSVAVARLLLTQVDEDLRWRLLSAVPFYQSWDSMRQRVFYRGGWDLLDLAPPELGADWVLDALERCEPETIPVDRLALAEASFGAVWQKNVAARTARFGGHQLAALASAHELNQRRAT